ncbi:MAG: single-stranded-DNA-specific exonuclease RecJ [Solirubrobacterales bacterium]|nr:single-stranded-DNA-specific exonuclease RecJ [Solirubrobacterales bacterium]
MGLSRPVATALVRRGYRTVADAKAFLAADERHDPSEFTGMDEAVGVILAAVDAGEKITIYGDFDVDGVASTSIMVELLRGLGAECDWFIPDRIDGYGLNDDAIRAIGARGTRLVITVDCGVGSVGPVALARELGMKVVVTDHHQPGADLPDCPILHPEVSGYPFKELCGAAVAWKLACAIRRARGLNPSLDEKDLDLVGLATVADVMPLVGENRRLVREGVAVGRRAERIGLRALMKESRVEPARLTAEDFGFRLGPRINAAGRMYRADAGVELFLADSDERADEIGVELGRANLDRRKVEREVGTAAEAARRELDDPDAAALVVAGEDWHPGVIGIVAGRLAREHGRPAVVIAIGDGVARGSARSVPGLDLHLAISECSDLLETFGGHKAAAGIGILPGRIDEFRRTLGKAVVEQIGTELQMPKLRIDAIVGGDDLGLPLAEEFELLAPFGQANRSVTLLVPGARICDVREIGEGKHARFTLNSGGRKAAGICFGRTSFGVGEDDPVDVAAELSVNHWNGSVEPQVKLDEVFPVVQKEGSEPLPGCEALEWWDRFEVALADAGSQPVGDSANSAASEGGSRSSTGTGGLPGVRIAELVSSGESLAIGTADSIRRWRDLGGAAGLGRFREDAAVGAIWSGSPASRLEVVGGLSDGGVLVFEFSQLESRPDLVSGFDNVATLDSPCSPGQDQGLGLGDGLIHPLAGSSELEFTRRSVAHRFDHTGRLRQLFKNLKDADQLRGELLRNVLVGPPEDPLSPEGAATQVRILGEVGLIRTDGRGDARSLGVVSSGKVNLDDSPTFAGQAERQKEQLEFLRQPKKSMN